MTPDEMDKLVKANDEAKRLKVSGVADKVHSLILRSLDPSNAEEAANAIGRVQTILQSNGLDPTDFKVMPAIERTSEELLTEYKLAKAEATSSVSDIQVS